MCKGNRGMVAVAANGNVFPCHQMSGYYEQHGDILGNAKREPLSQLLSGGPYLDEVCTTLGTLREKNTKCASCAYFELCNGGCRAVALALTATSWASTRPNVCSGSGAITRRSRRCCRNITPFIQGYERRRKDAIHPFARFSLKLLRSNPYFSRRMLPPFF